MNLAVFDFDKTLTEKDTLFGFYRELDGQSPFFSLKRALLLGVALLYKLALITNDHLKAAGIWLFVKGKTSRQVEDAAERYAGKIELNSIYEQYYLPLPQDCRLIVSASLEVYLKKKFPGEKVMGSTLLSKDEKVSGLGLNLFGKQKERSLEAAGIMQCSQLFTDSYSDRPLMKLAREVYLVERGAARKIKG